ncbi:GNAT family N-acetyltransferase [Amycolatopsis lurida]
MAIDTPYASVRPAAEADRRVASDVLVDAFMDDPVVCWLHPERSERARLQAEFYRPLLAHGEVYLVGREEGAAVWLPLAAGPWHPESDDEEVDPRLRALGRVLGDRHPGQAHLYLPCMGVIAARQGSGLGSALLRHRLARADADGIAAYLEASSPRSRALYRRHGFEDSGPPVQVGDSPLLWPMVREPKHTK